MNYVHGTGFVLDRAGPASSGRMRAALRALVAAFVEWRRAVRERRELATIDARTLRDICLSHADVIRHLEAPAWPRIVAAARAAWRRP